MDDIFDEILQKNRVRLISSNKHSQLHNIKMHVNR